MSKKYVHNPCLPLMREVGFAKRNPEGENVPIVCDNVVISELLLPFSQNFVLTAPLTRGAITEFFDRLETTVIGKITVVFV